MPFEDIVVDVYGTWENVKWFSRDRVMELRLLIIRRLQSLEGNPINVWPAQMRRMVFRRRRMLRDNECRLLLIFFVGNHLPTHHCYSLIFSLIALQPRGYRRERLAVRRKQHILYIMRTIMLGVIPPQWRYFCMERRLHITLE